LMVMAVFVQRPRSVIANDCRSGNIY
jgi:hypothetical protein